MDALPQPASPLAGAGDPFAATLPPSLPAPPAASSSSLNLTPSLLIIAALLAFVFFVSVSIDFLLRCIARASSEAEVEEAGAGSSGRRGAVAETAGREDARSAEAVDDEKERLIASLPLFTMASALAALPKSSPNCVVCLSPFTPDAELRLLPACRHAFHAAYADAWLRTTPSCPLCRAAVSLTHQSLPAAAQEPLGSRDRSLSGRGARRQPPRPPPAARLSAPWRPRQPTFQRWLWGGGASRGGGGIRG